MSLVDQTSCRGKKKQLVGEKAILIVAKFFENGNRDI